MIRLGTLGGPLIGSLNSINIYSHYITPISLNSPYSNPHKLQGSLLGVPPRVLRIRVVRVMRFIGSLGLLGSLRSIDTTPSCCTVLVRVSGMVSHVGG